MSAASLLAAAIDRNDVAEYVDAAVHGLPDPDLRPDRDLLGGHLPGLAALQPRRCVRVTDFIEQSVDPYLNLFRRFLPPIGGGRMALDLSPIVGVIILILLQGIVVGLING